MNKNEGLELVLVGRLADAFERTGWRVQREVRGPRDRRADLVCESDGQTYAVELKALAGAGRIGLLRGLLADAVLRSRVAAKEIGARPLVVIAATVLSDAMTEQLRSYRDAFASDVAWGAMDLRGRSELVGPGLADVERALGPGAADSPSREVVVRPGGGGVRIGGGAPTVRTGPPPNPFSDLGQWMIKVLLAPRVPPSLLAAPRKGIRGVRELADRAGVSAYSASRLVRSLRELGCLEDRSGVLEVVRLHHFLQHWSAAVQRAPMERGGCFPLPVQDRDAELERLLARQAAQVAGRRGCLALFSASRALGLGWVRGAPAHIYSEDLSDSGLRQMGLSPAADMRDADVVVRRPRFPEALFRGCVDRRGVPVADGLQCWLDLICHPARGAEQASEILQQLGLSVEEERD